MGNGEWELYNEFYFRLFYAKLMKKMIKKPRLFLLALLLFCFSTPLWARDVTITVTDFDIDLPLEGATVRSWDGSDHICNENGQVHISVPDDRQVSIQISYPGYELGRLVIPLRGDNFPLGLRLGGAVQSRELVIEAQRPGISETKSGRSVAISGEAMERSSQIGIIEDVMTSIKLLPGVGYSGMFNALPSIRGGDPGDLMSALDGFYIENPYHWGGGFSIFDPHMVSSAQLSHGIFSTRYGHTISGLLEVSSRRAATDYAELEVGISTSAVNLNAALPIGLRTEGSQGGLMLMGKVTYWDPFIWSLKQLSKVWDNETLQMVNAVTTAPYIRSSAASFFYRFNSDLEMSLNAFVGTDGVGADYLNESPNAFSTTALVESRSHMVLNWDNLQMFLISGLSYNPHPSMLLKAKLGAGYEQAKINALNSYDYLRVYEYKNGIRFLSYELGGEYLGSYFDVNQSSSNVQGRLDFDWSLGNGFLFALGFQELFNQRVSETEGKFFIEQRITGPYPLPPLQPIIPVGEERYIHYPRYGSMPETRNQRFNSSAYILSEYANPAKRFGAELGLRVDHLYFLGKDFSIQTMPVFNPRLNLDYNVLRGGEFVESLDLTFGTGLFSSMNNAIASISVDDSIGDFELKPNRSWTSVIGVKADISGGWSFNLEGYYKYVFDRAYQYTILEPGSELSSRAFRFNASGIIWGFDLMLQKFESRYWDGWLSYTFTNARYYIPEYPVSNRPGEIIEYGWYYPNFHRFHNINLVLNFRPVKNFNIYTRLGLASGRPKVVTGEITAYDVELWDENGPVLVPDENNPGKFKTQVIKKYKRRSWYDDDSRTTWSVPLDLKLSYSFSNPRNKVQTEIYLAAENLFSLIYKSQANTSFNGYTGQEDTGSDSASYEMPVPMVSIGFKWSY